jgi:cell wall-associated NlpC family hydrolase
VRLAVRLLLVVATVVTAAAVCLCLGVAATVGAPSGSALPAGAAPLGPDLVPGTGESPAAAEAVSWALARLGTPYRWGGEGNGGFDCSGLVQAAFAAAGIHLPRVAQEQYDAGPRLPPPSPLEPGDLVFFGSSPQAVDHVGIVVDTGEMVDAPHTGAVVRVEPIWSSGFVGATRPAP